QPKEDTAREQYRLGQLWIKTFSQDFDAPEGRAVRFLLGKVCINLAQALNQEKNPKRAQINEYYTEAERLLKGLEQSENEYTDVARQMRIDLIFTRTGEGKTAIKDLLTFDACYIRAIYEANQMESDAKSTKDPSELEKKHKQRNENIIAALK